jgi:hypothetical protein
MVPAKAVPGQPFISQSFLNHRRGRRVSYAGRRLFRPWMGDETNLRRDETIFRFGEDSRKRTLGINPLTKRRADKAHDWGPS